ncbi:MAG: hypothetical protein E5X64_26240, partial [Mesorhizobium sp.]
MQLAWYPGNPRSRADFCARPSPNCAKSAVGWTSALRGRAPPADAQSRRGHSQMTAEQTSPDRRYAAFRHKPFLSYWAAR